jgi:2-dehydropantoate 2-reductase
MKILIYGAGVMGTLYAARLQDSGQDVSLVARGQRLADLRQHGLVLENMIGGRQTVSRVRITERVNDEDSYDLAIVLMRKNQVATVLPILANCRKIPTILFMHNNAAGPDAMVNALGRGRVLLGFPGAGGTLENHVVKYVLVPQQATTLGEVDGQITPRLRQVADVFSNAGFAVQMSPQMDAWLKTHVAFVTSICGALYMSGCDPRTLANTPQSMSLMVSAIREGFAVLHALKVPVRPLKLRWLFEWMPRVVPIIYWRKYFNTPMADYALARHARAAGDEMKAIADEFRTLVRASCVSTPALDQLYSHIDEYAAGTGRTRVPPAL